MLWFEDYIPVTSRVAAVFTIGAAFGPDIILTLAGQIIAHEPMSLIFMTMVLIIAFTILFFSAWILLYSAKRANKE